ncbi:hypothetical protein [Nocardia niigatensis]
MSEYILTADYFDQIVEVREDGTAKRYAKRRRGDILVGLSEDDVDRLIAAGAIAAASATEVDGENPAIIDPAQPLDVILVQGEGGTTVATPDVPTPVADVPAEVPVAPRKTATLVEWQAYGVAHGLSEAEAAGLTRAELIERFGA